MLKLEQVNRVYDIKGKPFYALKNINLTIEEGEMLVILGHSGSGKSTLLNVISGLDRATSGDIQWGEESLTAFSDTALETYRRKEVGFIFQTYNLIPNLTVRENIALGEYLSETKDETIIDRLLAMFELTPYQNWFPYQLSGGGKQRVAICRALAKKPRILVCDEPTGALDEQNATKVLKQLQIYNETYQTTVVLITHNPIYAKAGHRAIYLNNGELTSEVRNKTITPAEQLLSGSMWGGIDV
jgi:putative ABC transport system ATP-binding protein